MARTNHSFHYVDGLSIVGVFRVMAESAATGGEESPDDRRSSSERALPPCAGLAGG